MLFVGTWPRGSNVEHRPHREILGAYLATECAAQHIDLRGRMILFRNDAEAAILALTKGSFASPVMQRSAVRQQAFVSPGCFATVQARTWADAGA